MKFKKVLAGVCAGAMVMGMSVMPVCADDSTATWNVAFNGFNTSWGGWSSVSGEAGVLELEATVQDIMDANGITDITEFGGYIFQVWNTELGDQIEYTLTVNGEVYKEGTHTVATGDDGNIDYSIVQAENKTGFGWGAYEMKATDVLKATVALAQEESSEETSSATTTISADCKYTDGKTPSALFEVTGDVTSITADVVYAEDQGDAFNFNDWCGNGVIVTKADGTKTYYQWGGAQVTWGWDIDDDKNEESVNGVNGTTWLGTVVDRQVSMSIPVEKGDTVGFYTLGWDSYDGVQYTVSVSSDVASDVTSTITVVTPVEDPSEEEPSEEQPSEEQPSEADPSDNDVPSTPSNPDGDVTPVAGLAVVAVAALGAAVVCLKKKENA